MLYANGKKNLICFFTIAAIFTTLAFGCSSFSQFQKSGKKNKTVKKGPSPIYYDFNDVLIPKELKVDRKSSYVIQAQGPTSGVLVLSGNVEINSLSTFFINNMAKDQWKMISAVKASRTMLLFKKDNRWCVINIKSNDLFGEDVEIWVTPVSGSIGSGLMK